MNARYTHDAARRLVPYALMLLMGFGLLFLPEQADIESIQRTAWLCMAVAAAAWLVLCRFSRRARSAEGLMVLMVVMGLILRIAYVCYTPVWERQHDIGLWSGGTLAGSEFGHARYIAHYIENWRPIRETYWQFHHPPLYHFLSGKLAALLTALGKSEPAIPEALQLFGTSISGMTLVVCRRLLRRLGLRGGPLATAMALLCFHPTFVILSGSLNNDNLMIFFVLAAALLTLQWYDAPNLSHTLLLALAIGLGMMTKLSAFQIAVVTAIVMLYKLYHAAKDGESGIIWRRLGVFFAVCVPLGLWYVLYLGKMFGLPPGYVPPSGMDLFTGNAGLVDRVLTIPANSLSSMPYCVIDPNVDYNLWMYVFKCSIFGEYSYQGVAAGFATAFVWLNIALIALSLASMVYVLCFRQNSESAMEPWFLFGIWASQVAFFIYFNLKLPFVPTMDFRYLVPTVICGAGFLALAAQRLRERHTRLWRICRIPAGLTVTAFAVFSCVFYLTISG